MTIPPMVSGRPQDVPQDFTTGAQVLRAGPLGFHSGFARGGSAQVSRFGLPGAACCRCCDLAAMALLIVSGAQFLSRGPRPDSTVIMLRMPVCPRYLSLAPCASSILRSAVMCWPRCALWPPIRRPQVPKRSGATRRGGGYEQVTTGLSASSTTRPRRHRCDGRHRREVYRRLNL